MAQDPQIQIEETLHEIAKDNGNYHSAGLKRLVEKFHRYRNALERNNNDLRQQVARLSQCIEVSVADTGTRLKPEDQMQIFEPSKQVDESMSRRHQGSGIGLPLAKKLVELHGGKIWAESEGPNKGAVLLFILPI